VSLYYRCIRMVLHLGKLQPHLQILDWTEKEKVHTF
jgi:hypothetical protein